MSFGLRAPWSRERARLLALVLLAVLLHAPCLSWGFSNDDYGIELVLEGQVEHPTMRPWSVYDFGVAPRAGEPAYEDASFPWWTPEDWKLRFCRPLTSLSLWLDQSLFGRFAPAHHATGLALLALVSVLAHALYRALGMSSGVALLALAIFALEDGSLVAVGWLANRNSLLEAVFTVAALLVLARGKSLGPGRIASALALALGAALCKESGIAAPLLCALFLAGEARRASPRASVASLRMAAALAAALAFGYAALLIGSGYGSRSVFYPTPWGDPLEWAKRLGVMLVAGPASLVAPFPIDALAFEPALLAPGLALALAITAPLVWQVFRAVRGSPAAGLLAAWTLLTLLPQAGAPPSDRLLFVPALGAAPLVALFLAKTLSRESRALAPRSRRAFAWGVAILALPISGLVLPARCFAFEDIMDKVRASVVDAEVGPRELGKREAILLQAPSALTALTPITTYRFETGDEDVRFHVLQMSRRGLAWTRVDERTFDVRSLDQPFLTALFEGVFLSSRAPPVPGQRWRSPAFEVEALEVADGGLRSFRVRCNAPLEDARWRFLVWRDGRLRHVPAPPIGATVSIEACERLGPMMP